MGLRSKLLKSDSKLEACLVSDPAHIGPGTVGAHVMKIQAALANLDGATIDGSERSVGRYGASTSAAVLAYKKKRNIVNRAYQAQADDIVGKMTIASLDEEQARAESAPPAAVLTMSALAAKDKVQSMQWAASALAHLRATRAFLVSPPPGPLPGMPPIMPARVQLTFDALNTHFRINTLPGPQQVAFIDTIISNYVKAMAVLGNSAILFVDDTTSAEAAKGTPAHVPLGSGHVNFTPVFKERDPATGTGFGPKCRSAMVLHEPIHIVDHPLASTPAAHVSELSPAYATQSAANSLHNAHSYAAFAQHVFFGSDTRFGAGKPDQ
jgi:peptidoglycan hydrolase-like protein with peptidoglycan-binding domain